MAATRGPGRGPTRPGARGSRPGSRPGGAATRTPRGDRATGTASRASRGDRATGTTTTGRRQAPPHLWRLGGLIVLLGFLALFLTPTLRGYLDQRAAISKAEQQITAEEQHIERLEAELEQWEDEAYIEQQARERLRFVKPGEVAFTVLDDTGEQLSQALPGMTPVEEDVHQHRPWYGEVWESVVTANEGLPEPDDG